MCWGGADKDSSYSFAFTKEMVVIIIIMILNALFPNKMVSLSKIELILKLGQLSVYELSQLVVTRL